MVQETVGARLLEQNSWELWAGLVQEAVELVVMLAEHRYNERAGIQAAAADGF